jgi:hypothetical protein
MEIAVGAGKHLDEPNLVALRDDGNGHAVQVNPVSLMQWPASNAKFHHGLGGSARCKLNDIDIRRGPFQSIQKRDDETANAV